MAACISAVAALKSMYRYGKDLKDATQMMNNMATTMVKQFEFSTRPIVSIAMSDMRETKRESKWKFEIVIFLRNYGPLPANKVKVKFYPKIWSDSLSDWKTYDGPDRLGTGRVLFAGEVDSVKFMVRFPDDKIAVAKKHENGIQLRAMVTYKGFTGSSPCSTFINVTHDRIAYKRDTTYTNTDIW